MLPLWLERSRALGLIFNALVASASPSCAALSPRAIGQAAMTGVSIGESVDRLQGSLNLG